MGGAWRVAILFVPLGGHPEAALRLRCLVWSNLCLSFHHKVPEVRGVEHATDLIADVDCRSDRSSFWSGRMMVVQHDLPFATRCLRCTEWCAQQASLRF